MADRIGVMDAGRLVQIGTPREIYEDPATTYVATRLGQPADQPACRAALLPDLPAPAGTRARSARAPSTAHRQGERPLDGEQPRRRARLDRASRRPEPPAPDASASTKLVTLADPDSGLEVGDAVSVALARPLFFDAAGQPDRSMRHAMEAAVDGNRPIADRDLRIVRAVAETRDRACRRIDRPRSGDRRRRPRHQHEARLRGRAGRSAAARRQAAPARR